MGKDQVERKITRLPRAGRATDLSGYTPGDFEASGLPWGEKIIVFHASQSEPDAYYYSEDGLNSAISDHTAGDVYLLPGGTLALSSGVTLPANSTTMSQADNTTIVGAALTLSDGATLSGCIIERTADDANNLIGVNGPASGTAYVELCDITCTQSGSGGAYAVSVSGGGDVEIWVCYLYGNSTSGDGYGGYHSSGNGYFYGCRIRGSTAAMNV